jgi:hypothetical protein
VAARRAGTRPRPTDRGVGRLSAVARIHRDTSEDALSRTCAAPACRSAPSLWLVAGPGSRDISWAAGQLPTAHAGALDSAPIPSEPTAAPNEGSSLVVHRRGPTRCPMGRNGAAPWWWSTGLLSGGTRSSDPGCWCAAAARRKEQRKSARATARAVPSRMKCGSAAPWGLEWRCRARRAPPPVRAPLRPSSDA